MWAGLVITCTVIRFRHPHGLIIIPLSLLQIWNSYDWRRKSLYLLCAGNLRKAAKKKEIIKSKNDAYQLIN